MSNLEIQQLLARLRDELQKTELDSGTRTLVQELDADIHDLLDSNDDEADTDSVLKRARELEADFATQYPIAERVMREVIDALARMGI